MKSERIATNPTKDSRSVQSVGNDPATLHADERSSVLLELASTLEGLANSIKADELAPRFETLMNGGLASTAKAIYSLRRKRTVALGDASVADGPAWDILLDLFISMAHKRSISVTSASIAASCPPTTALRWLAVLQERDLIIRIGDPKDHRRTFIKLSPNGVAVMEQVLKLYVQPQPPENPENL